MFHLQCANCLISKVSLNGRDEQLLLVDTGAAFNHLPTGVAQRHVQGDPATVRHVTEATGLDGRPVQLGRVVIDSGQFRRSFAPRCAVHLSYTTRKTDCIKKTDSGNEGKSRAFSRILVLEF